MITPGNISPTESALALIAQSGIIRARDLQAANLPRVILSRLVAQGRLIRIGRGLYRLPDTAFSEHEGLVAVAKKVPQAVFCLLTALQFHGLTTQLPRQLWLAMPRGSHVPAIAWPPLTMTQFSGDAFYSGIEEHVRDQVTIRVYGVAKTIADCFKHRNKIGLDVAIEALRDARAQNRVSADELWHFAKICRVSNVMRPYLEVIG